MKGPQNWPKNGVLKGPQTGPQTGPHTGPKPPNGLTQLFAVGIHAPLFDHGVGQKLGNDANGEHQPLLNDGVKQPHGVVLHGCEKGGQNDGPQLLKPLKPPKKFGGHVFHGVAADGMQFEPHGLFDHEFHVPPNGVLHDVVLQPFVNEFGPQLNETGTQPIGVHAKVQLFAVMQQPLPVKSGHALPRQPKGTPFGVAPVGGHQAEVWFVGHWPCHWFIQGVPHWFIQGVPHWVFHGLFGWPFHWPLPGKH